MIEAKHQKDKLMNLETSKQKREEATKIREQVNFTEEDIIIPDETLSHIISNEAWTKKEDGVRNLKRCLEIIYTKLTGAKSWQFFFVTIAN